MYLFLVLRGKNGQQLLLHFNQTPSGSMATDGRQLVYNSLQLNERSFIQIGMQIEFFGVLEQFDGRRLCAPKPPPTPPPTPWTTRTRSACRPVRQTCGAGVGGAARPCGVKKNQYTSHRRGNTIHAGFERFFFIFTTPPSAGAKNVPFIGWRGVGRRRSRDVTDQGANQGSGH